MPFTPLSICQKKITAGFDIGRLSSNGDVLLLAGLIPDHRDPSQSTHTMSNILRARIFAIARGCPNADDLDDLRKDPAFQLARKESTTPKRHKRKIRRRPHFCPYHRLGWHERRSAYRYRPCSAFIFRLIGRATLSPPASSGCLGRMTVRGGGQRGWGF